MIKQRCGTEEMNWEDLVLYALDRKMHKFTADFFEHRNTGESALWFMYIHSSNPGFTM